MSRLSLVPPLLYVLSMEVLAANVRCHPDITGLRLPGLSSPLPVLSLYADDTSAVSCSDRATRAISVYGRFEQGTGAKLNLGKCEGVWLGCWCRRLDAPVPIKWTTAFIKLLGVYLGNGNLEEEKNWRPRIKAVEKCLNSWHSRSLV